MLRLSGMASVAVALAGVASVGCLNTDKQQGALVLTPDARTKLVGAGAEPSGGRAVKPAGFDPAATGGSGVTVQNSFNRTTPGAGTGTSTGNFAAVKTPSADMSLGAPIAPPVIQGASYGEPSGEPGRSAGVRRASEPPPMPPPPSSPFGPQPPKLNPPEVEPPVQPTGYTPPPIPPTPVPLNPVLPPSNADPLPLPAAPPAPAPRLTTPDVPVTPSIIPSPVEAPIPGMQAAPKLPSAPPLRPQ